MITTNVKSYSNLASVVNHELAKCSIIWLIFDRGWYTHLPHLRRKFAGFGIS